MYQMMLTQSPARILEHIRPMTFTRNLTKLHEPFSTPLFIDSHCTWLEIVVYMYLLLLVGGHWNMTSIFPYIGNHHFN